jgi:hypothetical protein
MASPVEPRRTSPFIPHLARWIACWAWVGRSRGGATDVAVGAWVDGERKKVGTGTYIPRGGGEEGVMMATG